MISILHAVDNACGLPFVRESGYPLRKRGHIRLTRQANPLRHRIAPTLWTGPFYLGHFLLASITKAMVGVIKQLPPAIIAGIAESEQLFSNFR